MSTIEAVFKEAFSTWDIQLPPESVTARQPGAISKAGWSLQFLFGSDQDGEYLDYYASNKTTDDRHVRIREGGGREILPVRKMFRLFSLDKEKDKRLHEEFLAYNQHVLEMLRAKGFKFN